MKIILTLNFAEDEDQYKPLTLKSKTIDDYKNSKSETDPNKQKVGKFEDVDVFEESSINTTDHLKKYYGESTEEVAKNALDARIKELKSSDYDEYRQKIDESIEKLKNDLNSGKITYTGALMRLETPSPWGPRASGDFVNETINRFYEYPYIEEKVNKGEVSLLKDRTVSTGYDPGVNKIYVNPKHIAKSYFQELPFPFEMGLVDPKTMSFNYQPTEEDVINHEISHALNLPFGLTARDGVSGTKMYFERPGEILGSMGTFKRSAAQQGLGIINTPEDFNNVLNQIKIGEKGEGYWPNGQRVNSEVQRFLNTGRYLNWRHTSDIGEKDPEIWRKLVRNNNSYQQPRRSYTGFLQGSHYA